MDGVFGRRAFAAFRLGFALTLGGAAVVGGLALARPDMNLPIFGLSGAQTPPPAWEPAAPAPEFKAHRASRVSDDDDEPVRRAHKHSQGKAVAGGHYLRYGNAVCVRLCDGSFFPAAEPTGGDAACATQCPDAPVALYSMPGDDIDAAVSLAGASYKDLPVADRQRKTLENTCSCHRAFGVADEASWRKDHTLRKGDVLATTRGFVVFAGSRSDGAGDFVALSKAPSFGRERQADLVAMERVSRPSAGAAVAGRGGGVTVSSATP